MCVSNEENFRSHLIVILVLFVDTLTVVGPPRAPNRFTPFIARNAANAIPIEEEFNSGWPWLDLFPRSHIP